MPKLNPIQRIYRRLQRWVLDKTIGRPKRAPVRMGNRRTGYAVGTFWFRTEKGAAAHCKLTGFPTSTIVNLNRSNK